MCEGRLRRILHLSSLQRSLFDAVLRTELILRPHPGLEILHFRLHEAALVTGSQMVNCKYPVKLTFMNDNHAGPELCRLDQHLDSFLSNSFHVVSSLSGQLQRAFCMDSLRTSGIKTAPEHRPRDTIDTDHQGSQTHIHLFPLAHMKHLVKGPDQDVS